RHRAVHAAGGGGDAPWPTIRLGRVVWGRTRRWVRGRYETIAPPRGDVAFLAGRPVAPPGYGGGMASQRSWSAGAGLRRSTHPSTGGVTSVVMITIMTITANSSSGSTPACLPIVAKISPTSPR